MWATVLIVVKRTDRLTCGRLSEEDRVTGDERGRDVTAPVQVNVLPRFNIAF